MKKKQVYMCRVIISVRRKGGMRVYKRPKRVLIRESGDSPTATIHHIIKQNNTTLSYMLCLHLLTYSHFTFNFSFIFNQLTT